MKRALDTFLAGQQQAKRMREVSRIFVGGLSYSTNWQSLKDHFSQIGDVEFASVLMKPDGTSKGCGMVNYRDPDDAMRAVEHLNESLLDGRHIMVKLDVGGDFKKSPATSAGTLDSASQLIQNFSTGILSGSQDDGVHLPPDQISRVFVGNLSFGTTWQALKDHFKPAGNVEFASVLENPNKTSKGCGMVNFTSNEEARKAVALFHESNLDGRQITVKLDVDGKFKERPPPRSQFPAEAQQQEECFFTLLPEHISRVFVGNLSYNTNWQSLKDHFAQTGEIEFASVLLNHDRTSKGCGMVNYTTHEDAMRAVEVLNNSMLDGRQISVKLDVDGRFKERPPPGARPRVYQKPKEPDLQSAAGPAGLQGLAQQAQNQVAGLLNQVTQTQQGSQVDWLPLLSQVAQTPGAGNIDWPVLINSIAASAGQSATQANQPFYV